MTHYENKIKRPKTPYDKLKHLSLEEIEILDQQLYEKAMVKKEETLLETPFEHSDGNIYYNYEEKELADKHYETVVLGRGRTK